MEVIKFMNFFHLLAAIIWIGGMIFIKFILTLGLSAIEPQERGKLMNAVAKPFSITAWTCIIILILTGLHKTPPGMLFSTLGSYAVILIIKHIVILLAIIIGLMIAFGPVRAMSKFAPKPGEKPPDEFISAQKKLGVLSSINLILGIVIVIMMKFI